MTLFGNQQLPRKTLQHLRVTRHFFVFYDIISSRRLSVDDYYVTQNYIITLTLTLPLTIILTVTINNFKSLFKNSKSIVVFVEVSLLILVYCVIFLKYPQYQFIWISTRNYLIGKIFGQPGIVVQSEYSTQITCGDQSEPRLYDSQGLVER